VPPSRPSPKIASKPSRLVALVCASVVAAHKRDWLSHPVTELRQADDPVPETLSRLKARLLPVIERLVEKTHRRGRRSSLESNQAELAALRAELACNKAQLELAASIISTRGIRSADLQQRIVAAAEDLRRQHRLPFARFCSTLGIPQRTFRSWRSRRSRRPPAALPTVAASPAARSRNEGRFALELCPPDLQTIADTTSISAFGIDLRLVATQDPGRRREDLLSAFAARTEENADIVVEVITKALAELPGAQLIVDQGTPYLAETTRAACEALEIEHEPQKEGAPTEKATLERAFGSIKRLLAPLLELTGRLAAALPVLRRPELAKAAVTLLLVAFLRVWRAASSARHQPALIENDPAALRDVVQQAREQARADNRSRKLYLQQMHADYHFEQYISRDAFVRAHRRHALEDIKAAERILCGRACRCGMRRCDLYFAGILRRVAEEGRARRATEIAARAEQRRRQREQEAHRALDAHLAAHPDQRFVLALDALVEQHQTFWADGHGVPRAELRVAIRDIQRRAPLVWQYDVDALWRAWADTTAAPQGSLDAIHRILERERAALGPTNQRFTDSLLSATLRPRARRETERPPPLPDLTI
jgi:hypothetical protein